jgi:hypothetical protein
MTANERAGEIYDILQSIDIMFNFGDGEKEEALQEIEKRLTQAYNEGLEEAAKICEAFDDKFADPPTCYQAGQAIRTKLTPPTSMKG